MFKANYDVFIHKTYVISIFVNIWGSLFLTRYNFYPSMEK